MAMPIGDEHRKRRARNYALMAVLLGLVALFYVITIVRFGSGTGG